MSDKQIKLVILYESFWESLKHDVTTIAILTGLVAVNEATLKSGVLNFLFGLLGVILVLGFMASHQMRHILRSGNREEILAWVNKQLDEAGK